MSNLPDSRSIRHRFSLAKHPNFYFWLLFLALNALLFLPSYVLSLPSSTFLPNLSDPAADVALWARQLLLWRNNLDIFRLSAEFTIFLALWVFLPWSRFPRWQHPFRWLLVFTYLLALVYAIYEGLTIYFYQVDAVLYAHGRLFVEGLGFVLKHLDVQLWMTAVGAVAIAALIFALITLVRAVAGGVPAQRLSGWSKGVLALLALLSLMAMVLYRGNLASPKSIVSSLALKIQKNTAESVALYQRNRSLDDFSYKQVYDYTGRDLLSKPDVYLIFVESYGSILYKDEAFREPYSELLSELNNKLQNNGWYATSVLSESPTWGGGSWMAYTSTLFGIRIDNHPQYLALLERFQEDDYPDIGHYLKSQGYEYVRATSLATELPEEEWQKYVNLFGIDRWIRYSDINYQGRHYGWGPSPPDQYVLNAVDDEINDSGQPFLLFWITQNSHFPWRTVPELADDWRAMNDGNAVVSVFNDDDTSLNTKQADYLNAINYELSFLTDFVLKEADDDAIFVIIGDHQPGYVTRRSDGFDTPVHIISKDSSFLEKFAEYGFEPGLQVDSPTPAIRHEGFYSLFMRALLAHYGLSTGSLPPYYPDGIQLAD